MIIGAAIGVIAGLLVFKGNLLSGGNMANIFLFALFVAAGIIAGRMASAFTANRKLNSIYQILYRDADPKKFIEDFSPVLKKVSPALAEYMNGCQHLSFAYEALGEFDRAYSLVSDLNPGELKLHALPMTSLLTNQKANLSILMGHEEDARAWIRELGVLKESASNRAPALASNLSECIRLHNTRLDAMAGNADTDISYLEEEIKTSTNLIHQKEMQLELARFLAGRGGSVQAQQLLKEILKGPQGLWSQKQAACFLSSSTR